MTKPESSRPRSIVGWSRRRLLPKLAKLCVFGGLMIVGLWIIGRVLTDQYAWSQYLWWMPSIWMLGWGWTLLLLSAGFAIFSRRPSGLMIRPVLLILCVGCTGYLFFGVWHLQRGVVTHAPNPDRIRIVHWNQAGFKADQEAWAEHVIDLQADVVLVANSRWGNDRRALLQALSPIAPADEQHMVTKGFQVEGKPGHFRLFGDALVASRFPILRTALVTTGSKQDQESVFKRGSDYGWIMLVELDLSETNAENDTMVVWFVDLASNPSLWRGDTMLQITRAISQWDGSEFVIKEPERKRSVWARIETDHSFPDPDVIIGDFNTPNGSHSINILAPNMTDAYQAVGFGRNSTWRPKIKSKLARQPFKLADWHIDLALTGKDIKPAGYRIENTNQLGKSEHWMQILDILPSLHETND